MPGSARRSTGVLRPCSWLSPPPSFSLKAANDYDCRAPEPEKSEPFPGHAPMNYRHAFHAGNFADVVKHVILTRILAYLMKKDAAFRVIDTHAGIGLY